MIYKVVLIKIDHRASEATRVQGILTDFGCNIKTRLGLHEVSNEFCANDGLVVLEVEGEKDIIAQMIDKLNAIEHVTAKLIEM
ncbi:MAG: hypothetical protein LHW56_02370 [Candidatus Cloacimonetes bacterium]|jgi:hypothetical protein|nr:hypothetical protein [Candidatus Cloacimonadota bacterium]MDY0171730.1 hypothetical protein [Candidatus Cloacimonadaceae bacterium]